MKKISDFIIDESKLDFETIKQFVREFSGISVSEKVLDKIQKVRDFVESEIKKDKSIYGVNTGFGRLASVRIANDQLQNLQKNLILSHSAGVGEPIHPDIVRIMLFIKIQSLTRGYSGIRKEVLDGLLFLLNNDIIPVIPKKGSVGASGDLAPLSHMTLPLLGEGEVFYKGQRLASSDVLKEFNRAVLNLEAKEGLAIINGTQSMVSHGLYALIQAEKLLLSSELIISATVDAMQASANPFYDGLHKAKGSEFNRSVSSRIRDYLKGSGILVSHKDCDKVQDPYSLRCVPQVLGAIWEAFDHVKSVLVREANGVSDNPLIFPEDGLIISGGNFHGESPALVMDYLSMAMAELGNISERRIANLVDKNMSQLPAFLVEDGGVNSGFMIAHVTAAALASENKGLATPSSVDSIPTSANQEDHVSMGHRSGTKLLEIIENTNYILAIELLAALQGIDFRHPVSSSAIIEDLLAHVREHIPTWKEDRLMNRDIEYMKNYISDGKLLELVK